ncbi:MAG: PRTRC system protein C [Methylobacter sp.]|jgi:PRTRC genetic system protein C|nr:PRTRC system protein C [Methylobacter sp.]
MARIFKYEGKEYPDPDPNMSIEDVKNHMTDFFPELANAEIVKSKGGVLDSDDVITFKKRVGTKG